MHSCSNVLLKVALLLLCCSLVRSAPVETRHAASSGLLQTFERAAFESAVPIDEDAIISTFYSIAEDVRIVDNVARMLYTYEQQVSIFQALYGEKDSPRLAEKIKELRESPDTCDTIRNFMGLAFDNAAYLLAHGAGREHEGMRAFQQVMHIRAVLTVVLSKMGKPRSEPMDSEVCIDKVFLAMYGWLTGKLVAEAKKDGLLIEEPKEASDEQKAALEFKRNICMTRTLDLPIDVDEVKPVAGIDFPA